MQTFLYKSFHFKRTGTDEDSGSPGNWVKLEVGDILSRKGTAIYRPVPSGQCWEFTYEKHFMDTASYTVSIKYMDMYVYMYIFICIYECVYKYTCACSSNCVLKRNQIWKKKLWLWRRARRGIWGGLGRKTGTGNYCNLNTISKRILFYTYKYCSLYQFLQLSLHTLPNTVISEDIFTVQTSFYYFRENNFNALGIILIPLQIKL